MDKLKKDADQEGYIGRDAMKKRVNAKLSEMGHRTVPNNSIDTILDALRARYEYHERCPEHRTDTLTTKSGLTIDADQAKIVRNGSLSRFLLHEDVAITIVDHITKKTHAQEEGSNFVSMVENRRGISPEQVMKADMVGKHL